MNNDVHLYGIKNCDTVRKAIRWLSEKEIDCEFHDLKKEALDKQLIIEWLGAVGQDKLINKRGLTWRNLESEQKIIPDQPAAVQLIQQNPIVVKRPVVFNGMFWSVGFAPEKWNELFL